jgi:tryptophan-rich sensory protein
MGNSVCALIIVRYFHLLKLFFTIVVIGSINTTGLQATLKLGISFTMHRLMSLAIFIALVTLVVVASTQFLAGDWYQGMNQPAWNPPALIVAIVWAVLYLLLAVSAWMLWESARGASYLALVWWFMQLLVSVVWSWLYFDLHRVGWAMVAMGVWLLLSLATIKAFRSFRPEAASLIMPVAAWLVFALWLNFTQWRLNGGGLGSIF